ncbi:phytanoyl-CoA dioxygenase family protein [Chitinophaga eiseniae]|uniref:Phytanoyl-CoA dioxygenase n=1 Tax=Chitinophaga eiseniae TaxID=634771 RepID=A0A847S371_9BACT|nr:phytanoyl-CoA dioxygenase family protein [Chitinophaga eiseniae]NLR77740.1 phytanoyl-CoA dioxygenase [Chitinophaga eiseniae]
MKMTKSMETAFREDGYLMLESLFSEEEVSFILHQLPMLMASETPHVVKEKNGQVRSVYGLHEINVVFEELFRVERLINIARSLLSSDVYIHQTKINIKQAFDGEWWEWHQDFPYWHLYDGMPVPRVLSVMIFLDEVTDFNGPLYVIPGTHELGMVDFEKKTTVGIDGAPAYTSSLSANLEYTIERKVLSQWFRQRGIFAATGKPGTALVFHGNIFHASNCNLSPLDRRVLIITYNSIENTLTTVEKERPTFLSNRDFTPLSPVPDNFLRIGNTL